MGTSDDGLRAVLSQVQDGAEHPILVSRKLLKHERNNATIGKALQKLQYYLLGSQVTLVTDHGPQWMARNKNNSTRITRWFLQLQDFQFRVEHWPWKNNGNADALSQRDKVLWANAPTPCLELRRGYVVSLNILQWRHCGSLCLREEADLRDESHWRS